MAYVRGTDVRSSCPVRTSYPLTRSRIASGRTLKLVMVGLLVGALIPLVVTIQGGSFRAFGDWVGDTASEGAGPPPGAVVLPGSGRSADPADTGSGVASRVGEDPAEVAWSTAPAPGPAAIADPPAPVGSGAQRGDVTNLVPPVPADPSPAAEPPSLGTPQTGSPSVIPPLVRPPLVGPPLGGSPPVGQVLEDSPLVGQPPPGSPSVREVPNPGLTIRPGILRPLQPAG